MVRRGRDTKGDADMSWEEGRDVERRTELE